MQAQMQAPPVEISVTEDEAIDQEAAAQEWLQKQRSSQTRNQVGMLGRDIFFERIKQSQEFLMWKQRLEEAVLKTVIDGLLSVKDKSSQAFVDWIKHTTTRNTRGIVVNLLTPIGKIY